MVKGFSVTREHAFLSPMKRKIKNLIHVNRDQGHIVTLELANYFSMKREIKNLIHIDRDQGLFRDS